MKLCKDCKHIVLKDRVSGKVISVCRKFTNHIESPSTESWALCMKERSNDGRCKPDGRSWDQK